MKPGTRFARLSVDGDRRRGDHPDLSIRVRFFPRRVAVSHSEALREVGDSILYITALLNDRPRGIDRYIDYFGDGTARPAPRRR